MAMETEGRQVTRVQNLKHSNSKLCSRHRGTKSESDKTNMELQFGSTARSVSSTQDNVSVPEPDTEELIREIALLELEVMYLEQYLLSLYRRAFDHQVLTLSSSSGGKLTRSRNSHSKAIQYDSTLWASSRKEGTKHLSFREMTNQNSTIKLVPQDDDQCSSASFSQRATGLAWISSSNESLARASYSCHSPPLSFRKEEKNHVMSLAEYLGANIDDHVPETPNRLSEQMVRCMTAIFCKLADPPMVCHGPPSSPVSLPSSVSVLSPIQQTNSPIHKHGAFDSWLINAFQDKGLKELSGAHTDSTDSCIVEVPSISRDPWRLRGVEDMLQNYKSVLGRLKTVDPTKMKHEEKLAFWVNVHNALVMHGLQSLFYPRFKNKVGDRWHGYAIEQQEPLLHFALCSGRYSDPAVRVYNPKRVFQQLEAAKEEYIQTTVRICKEEKIIVPKIVDLYAKDMALSSQALVDMVHHHLSGNFWGKSIQNFPKFRSSSKVFEWQPYNFNFRYLLSREVAW